jgi:hypothetical protein
MCFSFFILYVVPTIAKKDVSQVLFILKETPSPKSNKNRWNKSKQQYNINRTEEKFREELLTQMSARMGAEHYGEERAETAEALAELIIAEELKRARWQEADLKTRPKGDSVKGALAARLRAETTMTVRWIAERLAMGTRDYPNHLLYRRRKLG